MNIYSFADAMTTVAEAVMFWMLFEAFFERKKEWPVWIYIGSISLVAGSIMISNHFFSYSWINSLIILLATVCIYSFLYNGSLTKKIGVTILGILISGIIELIVLYALTYTFKMTVDEIVYSTSYRLLGIVVSKISGLAVCTAIRIKGVNQNCNLGTTYWILFSLLFLNTAIAAFLIFRFSFELGNNKYDVWALLACIGLFLSVFLTLFLYERQIKQEASQHAQEQQKSQLKSQVNHLNDLLAQQESLRRFKHDFSNQLIILENYLACDCNGDKQAHIDSLRRIYNHIDGNLHTGNNALDAILNTKKNLAESKNITFKTRLEVPEKFCIQPVDISVIFGNALDNAIEACERMEDGERYIDMTLIYRPQGLLCKIINSTPERVVGKYNSSKKDYINHGYGLENIRDVLKKYGSQLMIEETNQEFCIKFVVPS